MESFIPMILTAYHFRLQNWRYFLLWYISLGLYLKYWTKTNNSLNFKAIRWVYFNRSGNANHQMKHDENKDFTNLCHDTKTGIIFDIQWKRKWREQACGSCHSYKQVQLSIWSELKKNRESNAKRQPTFKTKSMWGLCEVSYVSSGTSIPLETLAMSFVRKEKLLIKLSLQAKLLSPDVKHRYRVIHT